jgi:hypothetical protein
MDDPNAHTTGGTGNNGFCHDLFPIPILPYVRYGLSTLNLKR